MKKILIAFLMIVTLSGLSYAVEIPKLLSSKEAVVQQLGAPLQTLSLAGYEVLWYTSVAPSFADFYYFQNNQLRRISLARQSTKETLDSYTKQLGQAGDSRLAYSGTGDSLVQYVHVWPEKGQAIITSGNASESGVLRSEIFSPVTLENFYQTWGKEFISQAAASTPAKVASPSAAPTLSPVKPKPANTTGLIILGIALIGMGLGIVTILLRKMRKTAELRN
jgi:hypothetical protein